ncbi:leukocyte surface antigen CD53-like isoform 2-T2 [Glossina fuscipes fuscipes]
MQSCSTALVKFVLFVFNVLFAISGLAILITGSVVLSQMNDFNYFLDQNATGPPIVLIVTGLLIFVIASIGCIGVIRESPKLLLTFALLLGIVFIMELAAGIAACFYRADMNNRLRSALEDSMRQSDKTDLDAWNHIQSEMMCCGIDNPSDWRRLSLNKTLPASCCRPPYIDEKVGHCFDSLALGKDKYFQDGCLNKLEMHISGNVMTLMIVGVCIAFLQILGIILAVYLASTVRYERQR